MSKKKIPDEIRFERKKINNYIDKILEQDLNDYELQQKAEELEEMGEQVLPVLISRLSNGEFRNQNFVVFAFKHLDLPGKVEALEEIIENDSKSDHEKVSAANILQNLGYQQDFEEISTKLHNPHQMLLSALENMINSFENETGVLQAANSIRMLPEEGAINLIENLKQFSDIRVNRVFVPLLFHDSKEVQLTLLDYLEDYWSEELLMPLHYLSETAEDEEVQKKAQTLFFNTKMKLKNLSPTDQVKKNLLPLHKCLVSNVDGDGGQIVSITRKKESGKLKLFNVFFNDRFGIKDTLGVDSINEEEYGAIFSNMVLSGIFFYEVSLKFAKDVVEQALEISMERDTELPDDFFVWHGLLYDHSDYKEVEKAYYDLDREKFVEDEEYLKNCAKILDLDAFESWFVEVPKSKREKYYKKLIEAKELKGQKREKAVVVIMEDSIDELISAADRKKIRRRLERQAPFLYIFQGEEECAWALAAAEKLKDDSDVPPKKHPLLREMMLLGLYHFIDGI